MAKRGEALREHILFAAKEVFLDRGFERASMDEIADRAQTSKRTLYAHFESKENLYLAVIELVRELFLNRLKRPGDYSEDREEALVLFCGKFLEVLLYSRTIQMCRLSIAEAERFPEGAARYFDVIFPEMHSRLSTYLTESFAIPVSVSADAAQELLGQIIHPRFPRALFGLDPLAGQLSDDPLPHIPDLAPIRHAVATLIASLAPS